jgi:hypothetical protein
MIDLNDDIFVSCPIKNDNEYLIKFTEHYLNLGFDGIYFYDNNDDDAIQPLDVLKDYVERDKVEIVDYRNMAFDDYVHRNHFFKNGDFGWVLFVDDDEFLELKKHKSIRAFLSSFDDDVTKIAINNLHYGDNEKCFYEEGRVQDRFKEPLPLDSSTKYYTFNNAIKSLLKKTNGPYDLNPHSLLDDKPYYNADNKKISLREGWKTNDADVTYNTAFIKHYCTKSLEEFVKCKIKRAKSHNKRYANRFDIDNYYFMYNKRTEEKERLIDQFVNKYL